MSVDLPAITFSIIPAKQLAGVTEQRALIVAQMLAAGTATAGVVIRDFPNDGSEDSLFGQTSAIADEIREFKKINQVSKLDVLPLEDAGAAVKGTGLVTLGVGPAGADSTIYVTFGSGKRLRKQIDVLSGEAITEIGDKIAAAFATVLDKPFTTANAVGVVTATAENGGTLCNNWGIQVEGTIADVTIAITGWTGGATDPVLTGVLDAVGDTRYQTIVWPSAYALSEVETLLEARFNTTNDILDGVAIQVKSDTLANLKTYANQNSQSIVIPGVKVISETLFKGPATLEFPDVAASQIAAIRALRLTNGAVLTQYLTTVSSSDQFGGIGIASLPYFNTALPGMSVATPENDFSSQDMTELSNNGVAAFGPNRAFNATIFGEFVTTYLTDLAGNADDSYKYLNTIDTASIIREYFFQNMKTRYAQTRLTDGDLIAGRDMANASSIRAFCNRLYNALADEALVQKGVAAKKDYNQNLIISVDVRSGTATIDQAPLLVSQFRAALGTIQINFGG